jgi:uncharacterized protein (DUF302 family)
MQAKNVSEIFKAPSQARTKHLPDVTVQEARARLRRALQAEGFSMIADVDLADLLNRRLDEQVEPYFVVEACHPLLAQQALAVAWDGGLLMPTKLCLWKEGSGSTVVSLPSRRLVEAIGRAHLMDVASRVDDRLERVFARLDETVGEASDPTDTLPAVIDLSPSERTALRDAARYRIDELMREAASTESHPLQHALAQSIDRLEVVARKLASPGAGA